MKNLKVTKIENGGYLNEVVENGKTIARYMSLKECACVSVDGSFMFFADENNINKLKDYRAFRERAKERAEMDEKRYNMLVADIFSDEIANTIKAFARNEDEKNFGLLMMNEISAFLETYPVEGKEKQRKINEMRKVGREILKDTDLVYRSEPGVTGEQENG